MLAWVEKCIKRTYSYKKLFHFFLLLIFLQVGCASTLLKDWVEEKGYTYYPGGSTTNILGWVVIKGDRIDELESNNSFEVDSKTGELPELKKMKDRIFEIKGSAEAEKFLKTITEGNITGEFELVSKVELTLKKPFKEEAKSFTPIAPCQNLEMLVITKVLNTGDMSIKIIDRKNINITSSFKLKETEKFEGEVLFESANEMVLSGKNFYLGYFPQLKRCSEGLEKEIILRKDEQLYDSELGIHAQFLDYRLKGRMGEALIYIGPGKFIDNRTARKESEIIFEKLRVYKELSSAYKKASYRIALMKEKEKESKKELAGTVENEPVWREAYKISSLPTGVGKEEVVCLGEVENEPEWPVPVWSERAKLSNSPEGGCSGEAKDETVGRSFGTYPKAIRHFSAIEPSIKKEMEKKQLLAKKLDELEDPWKEVIEPDKENIIYIKKHGKYKVIFGTQLGFPRIARESGVYMEVHKLNQQEIIMRCQSIKYEDVRK
jgi:hypothetical protein